MNLFFFFFLLHALTHVPPRHLVIMLYLLAVAQETFLSVSYNSRCTMYVTDSSDNVKVCFFGNLRTLYSPLITHTLFPLIYSFVYVQHINETGSYHLIGCDLLRFILLKKCHCEANVKLRVQLIETLLLMNKVVKNFSQSEHQSTLLVRER